MDFRVIRSKRKTMSLSVQDGVVLVRAPEYATDMQICAFVYSHTEWIEKTMKKQEQRRLEQGDIPRLTYEEIQELADKALAYIPERVKYYAEKIGVRYRRITIRNQKTRWGSCSAKGNLNFNCLLMLTPPEVIDSVVVHELCHLKYMNHSNDFYREVLRVFPDYWKQDRWLKDHGEAIMRRMIG